MINPKVSIIIPAKEVNDYIRESIPKLLELDYENYEIILHLDKPTKEKWPRTRVVLGKYNETPPVKRELGVAASDGEIIAFMDDDAYPRRDWLKMAVRHFQNSQVGAVYGPGVTPASDGFWAQVSGEVLSSPLTAWKYIYRYQPAGKFFRENNDLDCSICKLTNNCPAKDQVFTVDDAPTVNFLIRREVFEAAGGFNTKYYPGEDTKLSLHIVKEQKKKIVYDPNVYVWHHRRNSLYKHFQQNIRYAIHRGFFAKKFPATSFRIQYFIPTFFVGFVLVTLMVLLFFPTTLPWLYILAAIWGLYVILLTISIVITIYRQRNFLIGLATGLVIFLTHIIYGTGFVVGLIKSDLKR